MVRRTRWRAPPPKVLSLPTSKHTELCYAFEGKAHLWTSERGARRASPDRPGAAYALGQFAG